MQEKLQQEAAILDKLIPDLVKAFGNEGLEEIVTMDINFAYMPVLRQIYILKEPIMSELGKATGIQLSTLTRVVDKLVEKKVVVRRPDPSDRRVVRVSVTPRGSELVKKFEEARRRKIVSILKRLTADERKEALRIFQVLHQRICTEAQDEG
ncbi:hypothetical protein DRJ04_06380 [Candidatus Aerophobetes bacterium]|uniref:HTH marR-type domain-containing protein n=1 Tax=Aerophobetes bacterium TaxID=2030807 RepID=A0A662D9C2_UNCAE|nr:MAG: hypothetical protein DRJ04_06380 [Candidatus Aerophobetes bacterium]